MFCATTLVFQPIPRVRQRTSHRNLNRCTQFRPLGEISFLDTTSPISSVIGDRHQLAKGRTKRDKGQTHGQVWHTRIRGLQVPQQESTGLGSTHEAWQNRDSLRSWDLWPLYAVNVRWVTAEASNTSRCHIKLTKKAFCRGALNPWHLRSKS